MSVARNSHLTNKPEADGAFTLPPLLCQCYLTGKGKSKRAFEITPGDGTQNLWHRTC